MSARYVSLLILVAVIPVGAATDDGARDLWAAVGPFATDPDTPMPLRFWVLDICADPLPTSAISFDADLYVDGTIFERLQVQMPIACADHIATTQSTFIGNGSHHFTLVIDPENAVAETDESNNAATLERIFTVDRPDYVVDVTHVATPAPWVVGGDVVIHMDVCNRGVAAGRSGVDVAALARSTLHPSDPGPWSVTQRWIPGIPAGSCDHLAVNVRRPTEVGLSGEVYPGFGPQEYRVDVHQPYSEPLRELSEANNVDRGTFWNGPAAP